MCQYIVFTCILESLWSVHPHFLQAITISYPTRETLMDTFIYIAIIVINTSISILDIIIFAEK